MKQFSPEHVDLLAQTMFAGFHADQEWAAGRERMLPWELLPPVGKGNWRRAAQAAMRTLAGNAHWILTECERAGHEFALEPDAEDGDPMTCTHCGVEEGE